MSIVLASRLSAADVARLGNNLGNTRLRPPRRRRPDRLLVEAVNRSLAIVGEKVGRLDHARVRPMFVPVA